MAWIQKVTPPPNRVLPFTLKNFVGGLNNRSEQLEPNQATSIINMMFSDDTLMEKRYGTKQYIASADYGDGSIVFSDLNKDIVLVDEFKPYNDEDMLVRATISNLYINQYNVATLTGRPSGVNHQGKYFVADGSKLYVYGKFAQTTSTFTKVIGSPINNYCLMQVVSPAVGHPRLGTQYVQGVLNVDYTAMKIYYEPCENEFTDTFNGANVVPDGVRYIVSHDGRLFMSGSDKDNDNVFITQVQNPFYFPVSLPIQVPPNSDSVVGLYVYDDSVIVGRRNDVHAITGSTNNPDMGVEVFRLRRINTHTGFASHGSACTAHNYLFFLGSDGNAYSLSATRTDSKTLATSILSTTVDFFKDPISLTADSINYAVSVFHKDEWLISVADKVLVYSYRHRAWTMYNKIDAKSFYCKNNILIWGRADGKLGMFDEANFLDFTVPYEAHWYSKVFDMDDPSTYKQFREFYVLAHTYNEHLSDVNIVFEVDYVDVKDKVTVSNQIAVYGRAKWGDRFITRNIVESLPFVIGRRGRNIKFKFYNGHFVHSSVATVDDLDSILGRISGTLAYVTSENKYYLLDNGEWILQSTEQLNQRMKVYQINGEYELRGKR